MPRKKKAPIPPKSPKDKKEPLLPKGCLLYTSDAADE